MAGSWATHGREPSPDLTDEEYKAIKERYPQLTFNDEDRTFISRAGNVTTAKLLRRLRPLTPEQAARGPIVRAEASRDKYAKYIKFIAAGMRVTAAAERAGLTYQMVKTRRWNDPEFKQLEKDAEAQAAEPIEDSLYAAAQSGNVPAAIKWLEKRSVERWPGDKIQIESNQTIQLDPTDNLRNIAMLIEKLQARQQYLDVDEAELVDPKEIENT